MQQPAIGVSAQHKQIEFRKLHFLISHEDNISCVNSFFVFSDLMESRVDDRRLNRLIPIAKSIYFCYILLRSGDADNIA